MIHPDLAEYTRLSIRLDRDAEKYGATDSSEADRWTHLRNSINARLLAEDEVAVKPEELTIKFVHLLHDSLFPPARALYTEEALMVLATDLVECLVRAARSAPDDAP